MPLLANLAYVPPRNHVVYRCYKCIYHVFPPYEETLQSYCAPPSLLPPSLRLVDPSLRPS